jgi:hypothetical protein
MKRFKISLTLFIVFCMVSLAGANSWAQEPVTTKNGDNKELKEGAAPKKEKKQKKQAEAKQKKAAEAKKKNEPKVQNDKVQENGTGNAYGKNKGDLKGKEFGQTRGEQAKVKGEQLKAQADTTATDTQKAEKPVKGNKAKKK